MRVSRTWWYVVHELDGVIGRHPSKRVALERQVPTRTRREDRGLYRAQLRGEVIWVGRLEQLRAHPVAATHFSRDGTPRAFGGVARFEDADNVWERLWACLHLLSPSRRTSADRRPGGRRGGRVTA